MQIIKYKDYEGTAEINIDRKVCHGRILFIDDLVTYQADSPAQLETEFQAAVDDYLDTCALLNRTPQKPLKGQFNVRVSCEIHKAAALRATTDSVSLNEVVGRALSAYLFEQKEGKNHYFMVHGEGMRRLQAVTASSSAPVILTTESIHAITH